MSRDIKKFICEVKSKSKTLQKRPSVQIQLFYLYLWKLRIPTLETTLREFLGITLYFKLYKHYTDTHIFVRNN